jgi:maltose alpha-D-glucosyltransferase/alpha-amylase
VSAKVSAALPLECDAGRFALLIADVPGLHGTSRYFLPLMTRWTRYTAIDRHPATVLAAVRRGPREGTLLDAVGEREFIDCVLSKIYRSEDVERGDKRIAFRPTTAFTEQQAPEVPSVNASEREQSNTTAIVEDKYVVKILRRVTAGIHPEIEVGRFLADVAHFQNAPTLLGSMELVEGDKRSALAVVHAFVPNQGDAWTVTSAALDRLVEEQRLLPPDNAMQESESAALLLQRIRQIGKRTAEMHLAFACDGKDPAFAPEPIGPEDVSRRTNSILNRAQLAFTQMERSMTELPEHAAALAQRLLGVRDVVRAHIEEGRQWAPAGRKIRHHGDFHLGQVLIAKEDAYILDFEGEPRRTLEERRAKAPPARDVAGFLRSLDYAASAALERAPDLTPDARASLAGPVRGWGERLSEAYWECYREALGASQLWPENEEDRRALLDVFLLEKALYEIEYELTNRPAWAHIPMDATLRILEQRGVIA